MIYGFKQSELDGTEYQFIADVQKLPKEFSYMKSLPKAINQGSSPTCVPCSISCFIDWQNDLYGEHKEFDIKKVFKEAGGQDDGMTFKDALKYVRKQGSIKSYAMVGSILQLQHALVINGPCIGGLPVKDSSVTHFWNPDISGFEGGHAIAIVGYDEEGFIIRNSWGTGYGDQGYAHLSYEDFSQFYEIWTLM